MTSDLFQRSRLLVGPAAMRRLADTRVILFGLGGVGSWCAEALVRSGVGHLTLVDADAVGLSNVNRQVQALPASVGCFKADELAARLASIHPGVHLDVRREPFDATTRGTFALETYDYVLDAIDSLSPKLGLILLAQQLGCTLYSSLGASAKLDPTLVRVASIWESRECPLARRIRKRLRHHDQTGDFQVVYSPELLPNADEPQLGALGTPINGSMVTVTATFGMCLASLVIRDVTARANGRPGVGATPPSKTSLLCTLDGDEVDEVAEGDEATEDDANRDS